MKWKNLFRLIALLIVAAVVFFLYRVVERYLDRKAHEAYVASLVHTASPQVQILPDTLFIDYLGEKRTLAVYLPKGYETDTIRYPVLYFMDGGALFDEKILEGDEWQIDEVLDSLGQLGQQQAIVIGVYNSDHSRRTEYKPFLSPHVPEEKEVSGPQHADWIATDVKKWVDTHYRTIPTPESTIIGGCSLSGLMAYYMLTRFPEVYGGAIVFSPSFWVNEQVFTLHENIGNLKDKRIYFNAGALETPTVKDAEKMVDILQQAGLPTHQVKMDIEPDEGHWHMTWRKGFRKAFPWILGS